MTPTPQQSAIFAHIREAKANLIIDAKAGSGKTTTIVEALRVLPVRRPGELTPARVKFFAFNKLIADTLKGKCPPHVACSTFHSAGLAALKSSVLIDPAVSRSRDWVDSGKCRKLVYNAMDRDDPDLQSVLRLVSLTKTVPVHPDYIDADSLQAFADAHSMNIDAPRNAFSVVRSVAQASFRNLNAIDFDDMLYLPVILGCVFEPQDWVFVDESQDTNAIQVEIIDRCRRPWKSNRPDEQYSTTRLVFVGDPHQAIYAFRGANSDAMEVIAKRFECEALPLSVSWRCSRAVIREAQKIVPSIEHAPNAPEGKVETLGQYDPSVFVPGSAILCRNNAPLVAHAYALLSRDIPCTILGKDIGASLIALVKRMRAVNLDDLHDKLAKWRSREVNRILNEGRSPESVDDQHTCLTFFIDSLDEDSQTVASLIAKIDLMFSDDTAAKRDRVTLSSIHKSKGLEYPTVFILDRGLIPSRYATTPAQRRQESNLLYVAQTRAIERLVYINSECWKQNDANL